MNDANIMPTWLTDLARREPRANTPAWFADYQTAEWHAFLKAGLPTRKDEQWKYTDLTTLANKTFRPAKRIDVDRIGNAINQHRLQRGESILLVCVNGYFMPDLSDLAKLPESVIACRFEDAIQTHSDLLKAHGLNQHDAQVYPFASLNAAQCVDGLFLQVPAECVLEMPIHLLSIAVGHDEFIAQPRNMILIGDNAKLNIVDEHYSFAELAYVMNIVTTIVVGRDARLEYVKLQHEGKLALHIAHTFVEQKQDSSASFMNISAGSTFARDDLIVTLQEPGADCRTAGFYHLRYDNQYIDNHVNINHAAPRSHSEMLYKGIMDNKSRAVFNGRLHVLKGAQKITAYQANHNLLLSKDAEVYSKPELEIYADDVKCKHGATTGQLDQDALFYLRARGIGQQEAMQILMQGFADDILQRVTHQGIKMRIQEMV